MGVPCTWSELRTLGHVSASTYLSTATQLSSVQILKYIDRQFVRQLDIKEGHLIHLILWRKKEEVEGEDESSLCLQAFPFLDRVVVTRVEAVSEKI